MNSYKKFLSIASAVCLFLTIPIATNARLTNKGDMESLINAVISGASKSMGKAAKIGPVQWQWCTGTYYDSRRNLICLEEKFMKQLIDSELGEAAVAFAVAHEYAHHVQFSQSKYIAKARLNTMRFELQADCYAGVILASIPNVSFNEKDIKAMITTAAMIGDQEYDSHDHHGSGENRALALRSGLRFGSTKGQVKDAYYKMFCLQK